MERPISNSGRTATDSSAEEIISSIISLWEDSEHRVPLGTYVIIGVQNLDIPTEAPTETPTEAPTPGLELPLYLNCGAEGSLTEDDIEWMSDKAYVEGGTSSKADIPSDVSNIYATEHFFKGAGGYEFELSNGDYEIEFFFMETHFDEAEERVFNILVNGVLLSETSIDIVNEVGAMSPLIKTATTTVSDGVLEIAMVRIDQNPKLNAMVIRSV